MGRRPAPPRSAPSCRRARAGAARAAAGAGRAQPGRWAHELDGGVIVDRRGARDKLAALYTGAHALVLPSPKEGFGSRPSRRWRAGRRGRGGRAGAARGARRARHVRGGRRPRRAVAVANGTAATGSARRTGTWAGAGSDLIRGALAALATEVQRCGFALDDARATLAHRLGGAAGWSTRCSTRPTPAPGRGQPNGPNPVVELPAAPGGWSRRRDRIVAHLHADHLDDAAVALLERRRQVLCERGTPSACRRRWVRRRAGVGRCGWRSSR